MAPTTENTEAQAMVTETAAQGQEGGDEKKRAAASKKGQSKSSSKKNDVDYEALEKEIATCRAKARGSGEEALSQAVEELLALEKTYRLQADLKATSMCCTAVVEACFEAKEWKLLNENVILISKRRAQLKQAVGTTVKEAIKYIEETPDEETKIELIKTLQSVTEGKIYLELERARLTRKLATIYEARGKIEEAAETLQEVAVETFGAMAKTEKIAFILEQVRLCLKKKDFIRAFILVKKVTPRAFSEARLASDGKDGEKKEIAMDGSAAAAPDKGIPSLEELKLLYYQHLIAYYDYEGNALEMCRSYQNIYDTPSVKTNPDKWTEVLKKVCWYVVLAPSGPMQKSILHTVYEDDNLSKMPLYKKLLRIFVKSDIVEWTEVEAQFAGEMMEQDAIFSGAGQENRDIFKLRVVDHNILVIGNYYSQITLPRLADILKIGADEAEKYLSDLVLKKTIRAKINRPQGVITFGEKIKPDQALSQWSSNISELLVLVESCSHKIHKECQQYKVSVPSMN